MSEDGMDLYRFFDEAGRLLYIGISISAISRAGKHRQEKSWWHHVARMEVEHHPGVSRAEIEAIERQAIRLERPLHNVVHAVSFDVPRCAVCGRQLGRRSSAQVVVLDVPTPQCDLSRCVVQGDVVPPNLADNPSAIAEHPCNVRGFPCGAQRRVDALAAIGARVVAGDTSSWWVQHAIHPLSWNGLPGLHRYGPWPVSPQARAFRPDLHTYEILDLDDVVAYFEVLE